MRSRSGLLQLLFLAVSSPALAQDPAGDLVSAISAIEAETRVSRMVEADLDMDGKTEALVISEEGCDGEACPWMLVASYQDGSGWGVVANGFGVRTDLLETSPSGHVIQSDGVIMSWDGVRLSPYFDLLGEVPIRLASPVETRLLGRSLPGSFRPMETSVREFDPFQTGESWKVFSLNADYGNPGEPRNFHVFDAGDTLRHSGASIGGPWIYVDFDVERQVLRAVSKTSAGLLVEVIR